MKNNPCCLTVIMILALSESVSLSQTRDTGKPITAFLQDVRCSSELEYCFAQRSRSPQSFRNMRRFYLDNRIHQPAGELNWSQHVELLPEASNPKTVYTRGLYLNQQLIDKGLAQPREGLIGRWHCNAVDGRWLKALFGTRISRMFEERIGSRRARRERTTNNQKLLLAADYADYRR